MPRKLTYPSKTGDMDQHGLRDLLIPLLLAAVLFLPLIGQRTIYITDEARYALLARNIVETGDWLVPRLGSEVHMEKSPLFIWIIAAFSLLRGGVTELTATLPSALSGIGGVAGTFLLGCRLFGPRAGLLASLILATTPGYFFHARLVLADMTVTFFIVWSAWAFWGAIDASRVQRRSMALFYVCVALAFSSKGPAGLMPIVSFGAFVLFEEGWQGIRALRPLMGLGILALVSAPWALAFAAQRQVSYVQQVLIGDYLVHFDAWGTWSEIFFAFGPLGVEFLPWTLFLPIAVWNGYSRSGEAETRRKFRFLACWVLAYVIAITLMAHKRDRYLLPVYPALALIVGWLWDQWGSTLIPRGLRFHGWLLGGLAVGASIFVLLPLELRPEQAVFVPSALAEKLPLVGLLLLAGILGVMACRAGRGWIGFWVICLTMALFLAYETRIFVTQYNHTYDVKGFARKIASRVKPEDPLLALKYRKLSYEFYLRRPIREIRNPKELSDVVSGLRPAYVLAEEPAWRNLKEATGGEWSVVDQVKIGGRAVILGTNGVAP